MPTLNQHKISVLTRRKLLSAMALVATASVGSAQTVWNGSVDSDWNNASNWSNGLPGAGNTDIFTVNGVYPVISASGSYSAGVDLRLSPDGTGDARLDQTAGDLSTGAGNWTILSFSSGNATYNLADTTGTGGTYTGFAQGSGSLTTAAILVGVDASTAVMNVNTSGTINVTGGDNRIMVGVNGAGSGTFNLDNGTVNTGGNFEIGSTQWSAHAGTSAMNMSGGSLNVGNEFWVGGGSTSSTATATIDGGTLSSSSWFVIGRGSANATFNMNGGTVNGATSSGQVTMGSSSGSSGIANITGGTFNATNKFLVGEGGSGTLNVSGTASVNVGDSTEGLKIASTNGSTGTVNLDGGTLNTPIVTAGSGTSTFNFNGGKLQAGGDSGTFMQGLTAANVKSGGAVIDTNGHDITIAQSLLEDAGSTGGGLTVMGSGNLALTGSSTYTGATTVESGATLLLGASDAINDLSNLVLAGGTFSEGAGFSETLGTLTVNADSTLNLVDATSVLTFADSKGASWSGLLTITGDFISGSSIRFGSDANSLTLAQLSAIFMNGISDFSLDASGYLVSASAVPEPSAYAALFGTLALGLTAYRRRRRA